MYLKTKSVLIVMLFLSIATFAQQSFLLNGNVVTEVDNMPAPGVNILVEGTSNGTTTDFDGNYSMEVSNGDVLQFSYIGFVTQSITISDQKTLNIALVEDAESLDEVVVIGYGTQKKSHLTGAISKVVNSDLDQIAVARVDDALVGQVSGVNVQATEGEAGSAPTIRIRGTGSINANASPLIVVDGIPVDGDYLGSLDMNDVESFEVLKDAASASIFGSQGGNGVLMITTKKGTEGKTKFSLNTFTGVKSAIHSESYEFTVAETAAAELAANGELSDRTRYKQLIGVDNPWQNIIFDGGLITNHSLSARGGSESTKFSTALNYAHDEGVLLTDDYKKYALKLKLNTDINDKLSFGVNISPSYTDRRRFDGSTHDILRQPSWLPLYLDENTIKFVNRLRDGGKYADAQIGDYAIQRMFDDYDLENGVPIESGGTDISNTSNTNPAAKVLERDRKEYRFKVYGNFFAKYNLTEDLSFRTSFGGDLQNTKQDRWQGVESNRNGASAAQLDLTTTDRIHLVTDSYFSYNKMFDKHEVSATAGMSAEQWDTAYETVRGTGYNSDDLQTITAATTVALAESEEYARRLLSFFGRLNYAFADKYLASFSLRRDGYSAFGPDKKYGNFPAASVGWIVSNESFLEDVDFLNKLKLRVSYGVTGNPSIETDNNQIDNYPSLSLVDPTTAVIGGSVVSGANQINIPNSLLQWERSIELNPGIDFGFFSNVISGSVDYYKRTSDELLLYNPISTTTGFPDALVNLGEVVNSGIELELRTRNVSKEGFKWTSTLLGSKNENELTDLGEANGQIQSVDSKRAAEWINLEGQPISSFYGWVVDKDIPLEYLSNPYHPIGAQAQDVYVKDLNGDGVIDDDDKAIIGNPYPDLVWSFTNDFTIGKFDVSFMFQGSHGAEVRNMADQYIFNQFNSAQDFISETPNQEFIKQKIFTDDIIQDASYIAFRNVNIGYSFSDKLLSKLQVSKARVYASGQNLLYMMADDYTGFNPESVYHTSGTQLSTTYGYQRGGSPISRVVSLGFNLEF